MLRVLSYNMWGRFGPYEERFANLVRTVAEIPADIFSLQEATDPRLLKEVERATGARLLVSDTGATGLAVLSRLPFRQKKLVEYRVQSPFEGYIRKYQRMELKSDRGSLVLFNTHLSWKHGDDDTRRAQVNQLHGLITDDRLPVILCGDFNCEFDSAPMTRLRDHGIRDAMTGMPDESRPTWDNRNPFIRSHQAKFPDRRIDLILTNTAFLKAHPILRCDIVCNLKGPDQIYPSDHYGVLAEFGP